jgi:hypothetical protein
MVCSHNGWHFWLSEAGLKPQARHKLESMPDGGGVKRLGEFFSVPFQTIFYSQSLRCARIF